MKVMKHFIFPTMILILTIWISSSARADHILTCDFKGVGIKEFSRAQTDADFTSKDGYQWDTLETDQFLQLRTSEINPDYVTNPFTAYLLDKKTGRMRQISGAMRAAPMMADGLCESTPPW